MSNLKISPMFFWKLLFANYHVLVSFVNLWFFCFLPAIHPHHWGASLPMKAFTAWPGREGKPHPQSIQSFQQKIHPLLYGHLMEFEQCTAEFASRESTRISTGQFLEHLRGSRFYPDKNVSCLDQNVASSTNLRICIYGKHVKLAKIVADSSGINRSEFDVVFFPKNAWLTPKKIPLQIWDRDLNRFTEKVDLRM